MKFYCNASSKKKLIKKNSFFQLNAHFMKKIPKGAEASNILVGELNVLDKPLSAFIRLNEAVVLGDLTEVPVPTRFIFILLGPAVSLLSIIWPWQQPLSDTKYWWYIGDRTTRDGSGQFCSTKLPSNFFGPVFKNKSRTWIVPIAKNKNTILGMYPFHL